MSDPDPTLPGGPERSVPVQAPAAERPSRGRSVAAVICVVLAALLTTPAAVAYWGQRTLNDTTRYVDTVGPLVNSPEVQDAIATKVTDAIEQQVDIEAILNDVFAGVITDRPRLQRLVGPLSAAINGLIDRQVREFLASDEFADLWTAVNTRAQQSLQRVLKGDQSGAVSLQGDQVVLDVSEVIDRVKQRLVDRGLTIVENVPIPDIDKQIVLMEAPQLKQLRTIYAFANPLAQWLIVVVAGLYLARSGARAPASADDGDHRGAGGGERAAGGAGAVGRTAVVHRRTGGYDVRSGEQGLLRHAACLPRPRSAGVLLAGSDPRGRRLVRGTQQVRHCRAHGRRPAVWRASAAPWPTARSATPADGSRPTPDGCASPWACWASSYCSGATTSRCRGCSGRSYSWSALLAVVQVLVGAGKATAASRPCRRPKPSRNREVAGCDSAAGRRT